MKNQKDNQNQKIPPKPSRVDNSSRKNNKKTNNLVEEEILHDNKIQKIKEIIIKHKQTPPTLIKIKEAETDDHFGYYPDKRPLKILLKYGIINIDKPSGPTSHQVSYYASKILKDFNINKAGHSGTLDPGVTGVLPIALEKATGITHIMLNYPKEYIALMNIHSDLKNEKIEETFSKFIGKIKQLPPVRSAVKRQWRYRTIYSLKILEREDNFILFKTQTEAGTYIRKLIHDIGQELGCGANMVELRRIVSGPFTEEDNLVTLQDLEDAVYYYNQEKNEKFLRYCIQPFETAVKYLSKVYVIDSAIDPIAHGSPLHIPGIAAIDNDVEKQDLVVMLSLKGELIAYGYAQLSTKEIIKNKKGLAIRTERVFVEPNTYPKYIKNQI